jgi:predicted SAM-dependent methyltransferase
MRGGHAETMATEARHQHIESGSPTPVGRLNWGSGSDASHGWINANRTGGPGIDLVADIREGLPLESGTLDYAVSVHALSELAYSDLPSALAELYRLLRPGGTLRLVVPDLDADIRAYGEHDHDHFNLAPDEAQSRGGRFIAHILRGGQWRTLFTFDFAEELLLNAGFVDVTRCRPGETASPFQEIVELDARKRDSIFVEATRPPGRHPFLEVLEAVPLKQDQERLAGFNLDAPEPGMRSHDGWLEIVGWVVGRDSRASEVEILADGEVIGRTRVDLVRPGVGREFAQSPGSRSAGFSTQLTAEGEGVSELLLTTVLEDGAPLPLWSIRVNASRQPPADPDAL